MGVRRCDLSLSIRVCICIIGVLTLAVSGGANPPNRDPETGMTRLVYIGDCWGRTPFIQMQTEPAFRCTPIPASTHELTYSDADLKRFMRLYMPRNYAEHVGKYDVVILSDPSLNIFTPLQLSWLGQGVTEGGQGLMMAGGIQSFGGWSGHPSWGPTSVGEVLPVSCTEPKIVDHFFKAVPKIVDHPFAESLPWQTMPGFTGMNFVEAKAGSVTILACDRDPWSPVLTYWETGRGSSLAHMPDWTPSWGELIMTRWEYYPDYVLNMVFLVSRLAIPQDLFLMHALRLEFLTYATQRSLAVSLMEFVEKFGARSDPLLFELASISAMKREADGLYLQADYESSLARFNQISKAFTEMNVQAMRLKDRALLWTYLVEWTAVSGTLMICGYVLWTVMVRRRLYREVESTRLA